MAVTNQLRDHRDAARRRIMSTGYMRLLSKHGLPMDKLTMTVLLVVLHIAASHPRFSALLTPITAVGAGITVDLLHDHVRGGHGVPGGAIITGLIVGGIVFPGNLSMAAGITALAMALKHIVAVDGRNLFNPAALGLYAGAAVLGTGLTWWVAGTPLVFALGLLSTAWLGIWGVALSFLLTYWALTAVLMPDMLFGPGVTLASLFTGRLVFFAFIMVVEPVTSPNQTWSRVVYGAAVAVLAILFQLAAPLLPAWSGPLLADTLLLALLVMNAVHRVVPDRWMA